MTMLDIVAISYIINLILVIAIVFFQRRDPAVSVAWVFCFLTLPVISLIVFLIFGCGLKTRTRKKYVQKQTLNNYVLSTFLKNEGVTPIESKEIEKHYNLYSYLENAAESTCTGNNNVEIITDGKEKFEKLLKDIENAKESINMLYFIIHNDKIGHRIIDLLTKKANEGVEVRLLYDGFGSLFTPHKSFEKLRKAKNGHVAEFFPVRLFSFSKLNHRNHRKIVVIDGKLAYLGGMNIGDEYMSEKKLVWRDTHMRITGSAVNDIQKYFALDWEFSTGERLIKRFPAFFPTIYNDGDIPMQIVASGPDSKADEIKSGMIKMINNARESVYIQTPYFVPDKSFLDAVVSAAQAGVDVRVMIPKTPDKIYVYYTTLSYMGELLEAGARVFLYPGFIHSKSIVVDDEIATIGTTNIDIRSFQLHFEINAFMYSKKLAADCKKIFNDDEILCKEMTLEMYKKRSVKEVMLEGFFRLFSPIM